jgi:glycosyltransferase involved in cell wall biosynthesis
MIPAYNCAGYLPEALKSVLDQDPGREHMQIAVIDDRSTDADVERLVLDIGGSRVDYFRQPENVGSLRNFETCLRRSRGRLVHLLHGDDKVLPGFYEKMGTLFERFPAIGAGFCRFRTVDEAGGTPLESERELAEPGVLDNWLERLACKQRIQTPAMVVRRCVYEKLGGFYGLHYGEDWEMWLRIAAHYDTGFHPEVLAEYRKHPASISGQYILSGQNIRDLQTVILGAQRYFRGRQQAHVRREAEKFFARYAVNTARMLWGRYGHRQGAKAQLREALHMHRDGMLLWQALKLHLKMRIGIKR